MDIPNLIRSGIFLVAGLILLIFPEQLMVMQDKVLTKLHVKHRDSKRTTMILGYILLIVAVVLFVVGLN